MKKTKKLPKNKDLYINKEGILVGEGHIVIGKSPKMKKITNPVYGEIVIPK